VKEQLLE